VAEPLHLVLSMLVGSVRMPRRPLCVRPSRLLPVSKPAAQLMPGWMMIKRASERALTDWSAIYHHFVPSIVIYSCPSMHCYRKPSRAAKHAPILYGTDVEQDPEHCSVLLSDNITDPVYLIFIDLFYFSCFFFPISYPFRSYP
jgi:hypothetical protein